MTILGQRVDGRVAGRCRRFIDQQPVGGFQIKLLLTCAAVLFLDGFDTQAIGYVAPALAKEWGLSKSGARPGVQRGPVRPDDRRAGVRTPGGPHRAQEDHHLLDAGLRHRHARHRLRQDVNTLLAIRFLTGLGLGGAMPNAIAMTSEFSPHRRRATMVMIMFCGFSVGRRARRPARGVR